MSRVHYSRYSPRKRRSYFDPKEKASLDGMFITYDDAKGDRRAAIRASNKQAMKSNYRRGAKRNG